MPLRPSAVPGQPLQTTALLSALELVQRGLWLPMAAYTRLLACILERLAFSPDPVAPVRPADLADETLFSAPRPSLQLDLP